jgi:hypothetical protein
MTAITLPLAGDNIPDGFPSVDKIVKVIFGSTSGDITSDTQETVELVTFPQYAIVRDIGYQVVTAFTASVTMTLGDTTNAAGWFDAAQMGCTTADTGILWASAAARTSSAGSSAGDFSYQGGIYCDTGARTLELVVGGADPATGQLDIYVVYNMAALQRNFAT